MPPLALEYIDTSGVNQYCLVCVVCLVKFKLNCWVCNS